MGKLLHFFHFNLPVLALAAFQMPLATAMCTCMATSHTNPNLWGCTNTKAANLPKETIKNECS